ncbi:MAG: rhodanese-like domain-containing protein [Pseudomonadota bacterium]
MSARNVANFLGDVSPQEAYQMLSEDLWCALVDVRTAAELAFVGGPNLDGVGKTIGHIEWRSYPGSVENPNFVGECAAFVDDAAATSLIFLCRSGVRSAQAAQAVEAGLSTGRPLALHNLAGGFEGDLDEEGRRGARSGWKAAGLPWRQS